MAISIVRSPPSLTITRLQQRTSRGATQSSWLQGLMLRHLSRLLLVRYNLWLDRHPHAVPNHCISVRGEKSPSSLKRAISTRSNSSCSARSKISKHKSLSLNFRSRDTNHGRNLTTMPCQSGHNSKSWMAASLIFRCVLRLTMGSPVSQQILLQCTNR